MPQGNFYLNRFSLLIKWAEGLGTIDGQLAASILKDIWGDLKDTEFGDTSETDPSEED
jgi:hypothetical protein